MKKLILFLLVVVLCWPVGVFAASTAVLSYINSFSDGSVLVKSSITSHTDGTVSNQLGLPTSYFKYPMLLAWYHIDSNASNPPDDGGLVYNLYLYRSSTLLTDLLGGAGASQGNAVDENDMPVTSGNGGIFYATEDPLITADTMGNGNQIDLYLLLIPVNAR